MDPRAVLVLTGMGMSHMNPCHPDWVAFVAQMRLSRADLDIRQIFADWCEDTFGAQDFAKFVRITAEIARSDPANRIAPGRGWEQPRLPGVNKDWEVYRDCERLLRSSWLLWPPLSRLPQEIAQQWRFHAGYPDRVVLSFTEWLGSYRELLAVGPVGEVHLYDSPGCHRSVGRQLTTLWPASIDLTHLAAAAHIEHTVFFPIELWRESRQRHNRGVARRLIEDQAMEVVLNRIWPPPLVAAIYIDEARGDSPEEYTDR